MFKGRIVADETKRKLSAFWEQRRKERHEQEKRRADEDWARVTTAVVFRMLHAIEVVGPQGTFEDVAVEFTIPNASPLRKSTLKDQLIRIGRKHTFFSHEGQGNKGDFPSKVYVRELRAALK